MEKSVSNPLPPPPLKKSKKSLREPKTYALVQRTRHITTLPSLFTSLIFSSQSNCTHLSERGAFMRQKTKKEKRKKNRIESSKTRRVSQRCGAIFGRDFITSGVRRPNHMNPSSFFYIFEGFSSRYRSDIGIHCIYPCMYSERAGGPSLRPKTKFE